MELWDFLKEAGIAYEHNVSLSKKSWIRTGGNCAIWICPQTVQQLETACRYLYANKIEFDIVGQTSNIFFHSSYEPQVVVSTIHVNDYAIQDNILTADCGVSVMKLAKGLLEKGYAGFSGLTGLPGTVAAAVCNNAGCFDCSIVSMLKSVELISPDGDVLIVEKDALGYSHRSSALKRKELKGIVLRVTLNLSRADNVEEERTKELAAKQYRAKYQQGYKANLGSVFASKKLKSNMRNRIASLLSNLIGRKDLLRRRNVFRNLALWLYGYSDLDAYVSERQINTFVWKDEQAECKFERYKHMMNEVYDEAQIEIEEKF